MPSPPKEHQFKKGQSGNPNGRPKAVNKLRDLAREHTEEALQTLVGVMRDEKAPAAARVTAAEHVLSRGYGRAPERLDVNVKSAVADFLASIGRDGEVEAVADGSEGEPDRIH